MATTKRKTSREPRIVTGSGAKPKRMSYPFETLKKPGDWFGIADMSRENSIRSQASKNQSARGVHYHVMRVKKDEKPYRLAQDGIVVLFDSHQP